MYTYIIYISYNNISGDGGSGSGSVLMGAILLRQMLICYIVKTPDGLTDSEIWGSGILSTVLFVRARARDVPRRRTLPLPFCIQRKTHPAQFTHPQYTTVLVPSGVLVTLSLPPPRPMSFSPAVTLGRHYIHIYILSCIPPQRPTPPIVISSSFRSKNPSSSSLDTKLTPPSRPFYPHPPYPYTVDPKSLPSVHYLSRSLLFAPPTNTTRFSPENAAICLGAREVMADAFAQWRRCAFLTQNKRMLLILYVFETFRLPEKLTLSRESARPTTPWLMDATVAAPPYTSLLPRIQSVTSSFHPTPKPPSLLPLFQLYYVCRRVTWSTKIVTINFFS